MNFIAVLVLPKTAGSAQTHKSISFTWIVWSTLYVYLCPKPKNSTLASCNFHTVCSASTAIAAACWTSHTFCKKYENYIILFLFIGGASHDLDLPQFSQCFLFESNCVNDMIENKFWISVTFTSHKLNIEISWALCLICPQCFP